MSIKGNELLAQHERMKRQRSTFDTLYQDIAERVCPHKAKFHGSNHTKGARQTAQMYDAAPALALDRFAAAVHSLVTPRNQVWHKLKASVKELNKSLAVQQYFESLNDLLFAARYSANFDNQVHESYGDLGAFGTMAIYTGDTGSKMLYRAVPVWRGYFAENIAGIVDVFCHKHMMTARNAVKEFDEDKLPTAIARAAEKQPEDEFEFVTIVKPRDDKDVTRRDAQGMQFVQYEVCVDNAEVVEEKGYDAFPYAVGRYASGEIYGRGPVELVLPDVKMLYAMMQTTVQAAQLAALPSLLAHSDGILDGLSLTPGAINYGGVDEQGRQLVHPLQAGGDVRLGLEMMEQKRMVISDALWGKMFQVLLENPQMTATQAMLIAQQQGALLAPTASRIESDFLAKIVERELSVLFKAGQLPPLPPELIEAGAGYTIDYESPMAMARKAEKSVAILRSFEQIAPMAQVAGPVVFKRVNWDATTKIIFEGNGVPASALYSDDEMGEIDEQAGQAAQMQQILAAAPVAASAAKDLAMAQATAASAPNQTAVPA